ncbi:MAG: hypothetical protein HZB67_00025 [Candidatus Aenigmarchaeota archaeon]|nr:hypothetical protein [Candidatus Aenigmarchaeota archaeon]
MPFGNSSMKDIVIITPVEKAREKARNDFLISLTRNITRLPIVVESPAIKDSRIPVITSMFN